MKKLNVAIIGQGRSGRNIHGHYFLSDANAYYQVKYVVEEDEERRKRAEKEFGCEAFSDYTQLFQKKDVDLVVNATYSGDHYAIAKDLICHGFHVLTEKPFARNQHECQELIDKANEHGVLLAVFQQTFFAPFYQNLLELIHNKKLGDIVQISIRYNALARRWDWQTLQKRMGGNAYNTGPHPFGMALGFLDFDENARIAYSELKHTQMSSGDSDDYCKVILKAPNKPVVDIEINNTDAYSNYNVKLQGTRGTFKCTPSAYECKYLVEGENEERPVQENFLHDENNLPIYCSEKLNVHEEKGDYSGTAFDVGTAGLYKNVYEAITEHKPLYVTNEMAKRIIGVIETIHAVSDLPVRY